MYNTTDHSSPRISTSPLTSESPRNGQRANINVENAITSYHAVPFPVDLNGENRGSITRVANGHPQTTSTQSNGSGSLQKDSVSSSLTTHPLHLFGANKEHCTDYSLALLSLVSPTEELRKNGYILQNLSEVDLTGKKRCRGCGKCK